LVSFRLRLEKPGLNGSIIKIVRCYDTLQPFHLILSIRQSDRVFHVVALFWGFENGPTVFPRGRWYESRDPASGISIPEEEAMPLAFPRIIRNFYQTPLSKTVRI